MGLRDLRDLRDLRVNMLCGLVHTARVEAGGVCQDAEEKKRQKIEVHADGPCPVGDPGSEIGTA